MVEPGTADAFALDPRWRGRIFALLRFIGFAVLFAAAALALHFLLRPIHKFIASPDGGSLLATGSEAVMLALLTALMAWMSGRKFGSYGLGGPSRLRNFAIGAGTGFTLLTAQLVLMNLLGCFAFGTLSPIGPDLALNALLMAALFLAVGFTEEQLFRGYALVELSRAISFWPAAIVLCLLFGVPHALAGGDNTIGGIEAGLFGLVTAYAFRRTGSLWMAIGYHAAWDYGESFIYGVPDSGTVSAGRLLHPVIHGPAWLSGGTAGPEGSVLATLPFITFVLLVWLLPRQKSASSAAA